MLEVLEVPEAMRCALLCMLEVVEGVLCALEVPEVMRCVLLYTLEAVKGGLSFAQRGNIHRHWGQHGPWVRVRKAFDPTFRRERHSRYPLYEQRRQGKGQHRGGDSRNCVVE